MERRIFEVFLECYIYCAPKGINYMQKRVVILVNGINGLENILGAGD